MADHKPAPPMPPGFGSDPSAGSGYAAPDAAGILRAGMPGAPSSSSSPAPSDASSAGAPSPPPELAAESSTTAATAPPSAPEQPHNLDAAQSDLSSGRIPQQPLRLAAIQLEGSSLRRGFLQRLVSPYLAPPSSSSDGSGSASAGAVGELREAVKRAWAAHRADLPRAGEETRLLDLLAVAQSVARDLQALELFDGIDASVVPSSSSPGAAASGPAASGSGSSSAAAEATAAAEEVLLLFTLREKSRVLLKSSTDVGNGEGSASIQGRIRNVFGGAEMLEGNATVGTRTRRCFNLSLSAPVLSNPDHQASLTAYALDRDCTHYLSCSEGLRGARVALRSSLTPGISHEFAYELVWRHLGRLSPSASLSVRRLATPTLKSSLSYAYTRDTREDPLFYNTAGAALKCTSELAGLGGDAAWIKGEAEWFLPRALGAGWAYTLSARAGAMKSLNARPAPLVDRFQSGGPLSVRMFKHNSLGPKDGLDSLGGDAYYALGCSVFAPVPKRSEWPIKLQAFCNVGQVCAVDQSAPLRPAALAPLLQPASSAGLGVVYTQGPLRVELNAGLPLTARVGDGTRKGLQLGIGLSFL